jgi:hypothetical protein
VGLDGVIGLLSTWAKCLRTALRDILGIVCSFELKKPC